MRKLCGLLIMVIMLISVSVNVSALTLQADDNSMTLEIINKAILNVNIPANVNVSDIYGRKYQLTDTNENYHYEIDNVNAEHGQVFVYVYTNKYNITFQLFGKRLYLTGIWTNKGIITHIKKNEMPLSMYMKN